jgi:hypothetical protein
MPPIPPPGLAYVQVATGSAPHSLARRSDGAVVTWGVNSYGLCTPPVLPAGFAIVDVVANGYENVARVGLSAAATSVGAGCGGAGAPLFVGTAPRIGHDVFLTLSNATAGAAGYLYGGGIPAAPLVLPSGCVVQVNLAAFAALFPVAADSTGSWAMGLLIPPEPALVGLQAALQIALFNTAGPAGFDLSNGLQVTVGY